jgi:hypothetical protein
VQCQRLGRVQNAEERTRLTQAPVLRLSIKRRPLAWGDITKRAMEMARPAAAEARASDFGSLAE